MNKGNITATQWMKVLNGYLPDIQSKLRPASSNTSWATVEDLLGIKVPASLKELYTICDGEEQYVGMILGFSLLSKEEIGKHLAYFHQLDDFLTTNKSDCIQEVSLNEMKLLPFAFDSSRCYFALDFQPESYGTVGQVVAIDFDYNKIYLIAESMDAFFGMIKEFLTDGHFFVSREEEEHFSFETGHFFNLLPDLLQEKSNEMIDLPEGFWQEKFKDSLVDGKVSKEVLQKIKHLNIEKQTLSCKPFLSMENLSELRLWECELTDFSSLADIMNLKDLCIGACKFENMDVSSLSHSGTIRKLCFVRMTLNGFGKLSQLKTLKDVTLYRMEDIQESELEQLTQLQNLDLDTTPISAYDFLKGYKKLKELSLNQKYVDHLDFLEYLPNLTHFELHKKAREESGLSYLKIMKKLKEFDYPVSDMTCYLGLQQLKDIGIDACSAENLEVLQQLPIEGVHVYGAKTKEEAERLIVRVKEYVQLRSYGYMLEQ